MASSRTRVLLVLLTLSLTLLNSGCRSVDGTFAFILVDEASSHALEAAPVDDTRTAEFSFNPDTGALAVSRRALVPGPGARAVIAYHARGRGVTLAQQLSSLKRFPWVLRLSEPLRLEGEVRDLDGTYLGTQNVVNNQERLVPFDLHFLGLDAEGVLRFRAGQEEVRLAPGESWLVAFIREGDAVRCLRWDADWEAAREALSENQPLTRLEVIHHGFWQRHKVRVGTR